MADRPVFLYAAGAIGTFDSAEKQVDADADELEREIDAAAREDEGLGCR